MKKTIVIILFIILGVALPYFISSFILDQNIKKTLVSLKIAGCPTTIAEIKPKSTAETKRTADLLTKAYEAEMKIKDKTERNIAAQQSDLADSISYQENPALFNKIVTDNTKVINLLLEASKYPYADFDFKYEEGLAAKIPKPAGHHHNFWQLLRIYAKNLYGAGKTEEALNVLGQTINLSFSLIDNMLLFHLVKALALTKTLDLIQTISPKGSVAALESLAAKIDEIDVRSSFAKATESEMIMWQHALLSRRSLLDNLISSGIQPTPKQRFMLFLANFAPIKKLVQLRLLKLMKKQSELSKLAYFQTEPEWNNLAEYLKKPETFSELEKLFIMNLKVYVIGSENLETKRNITNLGLKALIHKKKTGKLPKTLDEIVSKVPIDPYSGKKYIYQPLPDGFLIYSVGKDGKDDMGDSKTDIVWQTKI